MDERTMTGAGSPPARRGPARAVARFTRRVLVGVLVGGGTIFGPKPERDRHWSTPPTMQVDPQGSSADADGDGDDRHDRMPACA